MATVSPISRRFSFPDSPWLSKSRIEREAWGWAWADGGIRDVYVRTGNDEAWRLAVLESLRGHEWRRFSFRWTPTHNEPTVLASLAEANNGQLQPAFGRRNAIHEVPVNVV